jgi:hypothetical protein
MAAGLYAATAQLHVSARAHCGRCMQLQQAGSLQQRLTFAMTPGTAASYHHETRAHESSSAPHQAKWALPSAPLLKVTTAVGEPGLGLVTRAISMSRTVIMVQRAAHAYARNHSARLLTFPHTPLSATAADRTSSADALLESGTRCLTLLTCKSSQDAQPNAVWSMSFHPASQPVLHQHSRPASTHAHHLFRPC